MKLTKNVVMKPWRFLVVMRDGTEQEITVQAESYHNAIYALPAGKKKYKLLSEGEEK